MSSRLTWRPHHPSAETSLFSCPRGTKGVLLHYPSTLIKDPTNPSLRTTSPYLSSTRTPVLFRADLSPLPSNVNSVSSGKVKISGPSWIIIAIWNLVRPPTFRPFPQQEQPPSPGIRSLGSLTVEEGVQPRRPHTPYHSFPHTLHSHLLVPETSIFSPNQDRIRYLTAPRNV